MTIGRKGGPVIQLDLGDIVFSLTARVKTHRPVAIVWHVGVPRDTTAADRVIKGPPYSQPTGRHDLIMDLRADQQTFLSIEFTDEVGNPVPAPPAGEFTVVYTVDDPTIINLTNNGDGTANAAATGTLGSATVHVEVNWNSLLLTGDLLLVVVAGLAERIEIVASEPTEVTPDV